MNHQHRIFSKVALLWLAAGFFAACSSAPESKPVPTQQPTTTTTTTKSPAKGGTASAADSSFEVRSSWLNGPSAGEQSSLKLSFVGAQSGRAAQTVSTDMTIIGTMPQMPTMPPYRARGLTVEPDAADGAVVATAQFFSMSRGWVLTIKATVDGIPGTYTVEVEVP